MWTITGTVVAPAVPPAARFWFGSAAAGTGPRRGHGKRRNPSSRSRRWCSTRVGPAVAADDEVRQPSSSIVSPSVVTVGAAIRDVSSGCQLLAAAMIDRAVVLSRLQMRSDARDRSSRRVYPVSQVRPHDDDVPPSSDIRVFLAQYPPDLRIPAKPGW